jgi:hypothetical protein
LMASLVASTHSRDTPEFGPGTATYSSRGASVWIPTA